MPRLVLFPVLAATALLAAAAASPAELASPVALCADAGPGVRCGPGGGRRTPGGDGKVSHRGWPAITGILWQVHDGLGYRKSGGPDNDELLGHHGSDRLFGGRGSDVLWGDWDPVDNTRHQRDILRGGAGNDYIYPSHGRTTVVAGSGNDRIWAYYGRGTIDCGPGLDRVRVRLNGAFKLRRCEIVQHFCAFGPRAGGCRRPARAAMSHRAYRTLR
jgi:hypothetical protein